MHYRCANTAILKSATKLLLFFYICKRARIFFVYCAPRSHFMWVLYVHSPAFYAGSFSVYAPLIYVRLLFPLGFVHCTGCHPALYFVYCPAWEAACFLSFSSTIRTNTGNIPYTTFSVRPSFRNASHPPLNCAFHRSRNSSYLG